MLTMHRTLQIIFFDEGGVERKMVMFRLTCAFFSGMNKNKTLADVLVWFYVFKLAELR